jgi:hypothetical protein
MLDVSATVVTVINAEEKAVPPIVPLAVPVWVYVIEVAYEARLLINKLASAINMTPTRTVKGR